MKNETVSFSCLDSFHTLKREDNDRQVAMHAEIHEYNVCNVINEIERYVF